MIPFDNNKYIAFTSPGILSAGGNKEKGYEVIIVNSDNESRTEHLSFEEFAIWAACHGIALGEPGFSEVLMDTLYEEVHPYGGASAYRDDLRQRLNALYERGLIVFGMSSEHKTACTIAFSRLFFYPLVWENRKFISSDPEMQRTLLFHRFTRHFLPKDQKTVLEYIEKGVLHTLYDFCGEHAGKGKEIAEYGKVYDAVLGLIQRGYLLPCGLNADIKDLEQ